MQVRFWGTRGSLARPGQGTLRYGGNTPCVEVRLADGTLLILDCGTGAFELGRSLSTQPGPVKVHLLFSHLNWEHIQGLATFAPLFLSDAEIDIYAPGIPGQNLEEALSRQLEYALAPRELREAGAAVRFHDLAEGSFMVGTSRIAARYVNHTAVAMAYRVESGGAIAVYVPDHEPFSQHQPNPDDLAGDAPIAAPVHPGDRQHTAFMADAHLVIHDAQFTAEEYATRIGWGHSSAEQAVDYASAAGAQRLALFHHDPARDDNALDRLIEANQRRLRQSGSSLTIFAAAEGMTIDLREASASATLPTAGQVQADAPLTILLADDDPDILQMLRMSLRQEQFNLVTAADGEEALRLARSEHPSLIILDWQMPGLSGLEVCEALRRDADPALRSVPVVLLTAKTGEDDTAMGFAMGVTDYITKPVAPALIRARVRTWLLRGGIGARGAE